VPVLSDDDRIIGYGHPSVIRKMFRAKVAFVCSRHPFMVKMKKGIKCKHALKKYVEYGIDPGVHHTGVSVISYDTIQTTEGRISLRDILAMYVLEHKKLITRKLEERAMYRHHRRRRQQRKGTRWSRLGKEFHVLPGIDEVREDGTRKYRKEKVILGYKERKLRNLELLTEWRNSGKISEEEYRSRARQIDKALKELDRKYYKPKSWLSPATRSRLENIGYFIHKISYGLNTNRPMVIYYEDVRFTPELAEDIFRDTNSILKPIQKDYIRWRDNYQCQLCGYDFIKNNFKRQPQIDHIYPRSKGGPNDRTNLQLLCSSCNQKKDNYLPHELYSIFPKKYHKAIDKMQNKTNHTKQYQTKSTQTRKLFARYLELAITKSRLSPTRQIDLKYPTIMFKDKIIHNSELVYVDRVPGYFTYYCRNYNNLPKEHCIDAACVSSKPIRVNIRSYQYTEIKVKGHRDKLYIRPDKYGFPKKTRPKPRTKRINGYQSGDLIKYITKNNNICKAYVSTSAQDGRIALNKNGKQVFMTTKRMLSILHKADGYLCNPVNFGDHL